MTPIERAARAEYLAHRYGSPEAAARPEAIAFWDNAAPEFREEKIRCMRAALATLMEPGHEVLTAGSDQTLDSGADPMRVWQAMLKKVIEP